MKTTLNLFCIPFAGGNKYSYREYQEKSSPFLKWITLEYPGRGARAGEPLVSDIGALVNDLYNKITMLIDQRDYAIYGHSMGGIIGYLLTRKLIDNNYRPPLHLFITGTTGPSAPSRSLKKLHLLGKKEFLKELKELNGIPEEVLKNEDLLDYFEPILRADIQACDNYIHEVRTPLNLPITVITGMEEDMELAEIQLWQKETNSKVDFITIPGNHFFIFKYPQQVVEIIYRNLSVHSKSYQAQIFK